tara:strand:+ start:411 stop:2132 length:1722 start_codon:yes stop_codon:yes gene_type:complete
MTENLNSKTENHRIMGETNDEIDLRSIYNFLLRNKALIGLSSIIISISGILYSFTLQKVWEGQFQIVLNKKDQPLDQTSLSNIGFFAGKNNNLNTQVEILKSPSLLMPVFELAKSQKDQPQNKYSSFSLWKRNNLKIQLEENTSILNISYKNKDKKTIIPILKKISTSYQQYSGRNKRRREELTNNLLNEQISVFKKKSANSLRSAQEYAIDQDLIFYDLGEEFQINIDNNSKQLSRNNLLQAPNLFLSNIDIENARVQAANQIRKINLQLQKIKDLNNFEELQYIGSTIPALVAEGLPGVLSDLEAEIVEAKSKYTEKDITINELIKKRNMAIDLLKNRTIKYLNVQKSDAEATMKAAMRPKGVLLKYKELIREAARDEATLVQLEDKFNLFKLDLARVEDPWELITKPTLLEYPIAPNKKRIAFVSLLFGSIFGIAYSYFKEKKSDLIYDASNIEKLIPIKLISQINLNNIDHEEENLLFIKDFLNKKSNKVVNFVPLGNIEVAELNKLKQSLITEKFTKNIEFSFNKKETIENSNYLILKLGYINYSDVFIFRKRLNLLENNFDGLIILS